MIFFPAIDIKGGRCVRLLRGDMSQATIFGDSPAEQARAFQKDGCEWLHVVDLDAAIQGQPMNTEAVETILAAIDVPVQLGGGIRDVETVEHWLKIGVARVILGTAAVENPEIVTSAASRFPGQVVVALDARNGYASTHGWVRDSGIKETDFARQAADLGAAAIVYTSIDRDGAMQGPDILATSQIASSVELPVIASGGIATIDDLIALRDCGASLAGAICGRAIYDGKICVAEAVELLRKN